VRVNAEKQRDLRSLGNSNLPSKNLCRDFLAYRTEPATYTNTIAHSASRE